MRPCSRQLHGYKHPAAVCGGKQVCILKSVFSGTLCTVSQIKSCDRKLLHNLASSACDPSQPACCRYFIGTWNMKGFLSEDRPIRTLREITTRLQEAYCNTVGYEVSLQLHLRPSVSLVFSMEFDQNTLCGRHDAILVGCEVSWQL